jgi:hypothetical protein
MDFNYDDEAINPIQITQGVFFVPCRINNSTAEYVPCVTPLKTTTFQLKISSRHVWTSEEDENLKKIVENTGAKNWSNVAYQLNAQIYQGLPIRQGKQCRERWFGSLAPEIQKEPWSVYEDFILFHQQKRFRNKWTLISQYLPGRTEIQMKNRWRKIEKSMKKQMRTMKKFLRKRFFLTV